jgi:LmbE family N-acetylglucosaminyl deacetylase
VANILMLASFGLEIVECGGALAKALKAGDNVHAAVLMSRPESEPQIREAAQVLGITDVEFLGVKNGEVVVTPEAKEPIVELLRRTKPDVIIMQDPEHAQHDLDPDRRMIALLYAESLSVAGRDWRIDECGGHAPHPVPTIYYMTPSNPNCVIEISDTFAIKQKALEVLAFQMSFSAQSIKQRANVEAIRHIVDNFDEIRDDDTALGLALHQQFDRSLALYHGLAGHSGAVLGEAYRREGEFVLERLTA